MWPFRACIAWRRWSVPPEFICRTRDWPPLSALYPPFTPSSEALQDPTQPRASLGLFNALNRLAVSARRSDACNAQKWTLHSAPLTYLPRFSEKIWIDTRFIHKTPPPGLKKCSDQITPPLQHPPSLIYLSGESLQAITAWKHSLNHCRTPRHAISRLLGA